MIVWSMRRFLVALLLAGVLAACSFTTTPPTITPTRDTLEIAFNPTEDAPTRTPFAMPTLPPSPTPVCAGAPRTRLIVNERGWVLADDPRPLNLRHEPGRDNRWILQIPIGGIFHVMEGPVCEGTFAWFKVRYRGSEGWIAEGDLENYYVEPYLVG